MAQLEEKTNLIDANLNETKASLDMSLMNIG